MEATTLVIATALASSALGLVALRLLAAERARERLAYARVPLGDGLYASSRAPAASGGGATPGAAAASPPVDDVARRKLLRWFGWATLLVILGELTAGFLPFFWPRKVGAFGGTVNAGNVGDFKVGQVTKITEGKFYLSRVPEGFLALWQKCPHLGCTVPWLDNAPSLDSIEPNGRFNCPCHGSLYDRYGQIKGGPAPRPMDMFPITIRDGRIFVETGPSKAIQRSVAEGDEHSKFPVPA